MNRKANVTVLLVSLCLFPCMALPGNAQVPSEQAKIDIASDPNNANVKRVDAKDETGYSYSRFFTKLSGSVHPSNAPTMRQGDPNVQFQKIIHDGLVGDSFLKNFTVTFDLPHSQMIFEKPQDLK